MANGKNEEQEEAKGMRSRTLHSGDWAVVLAGGEGTRMSSFVLAWMGEYVPKQYCAFIGGQTLLESTWRRCLRMVERGKVITVVGRSHATYLDRIRPRRIPGPVLFQPFSRGTLPGALLAMSFVMAADPNGVVTLLPSDHFVAPEKRFAGLVKAAAAIARSRSDRMVLLTAVADAPETDYGWIEPENGAGHKGSVRPIRSFVEKPSRSEAERLLEAGGFWNTMVLCGRARLFWEMARMHFPQIVERFQFLREALVRAREGFVTLQSIGPLLEQAYAGMESADLCGDLLSRVPDHLLMLPLEGVEWSDWGRPSRLIETLEANGRALSTPEKENRLRRVLSVEGLPHRGGDLAWSL